MKNLSEINLKVSITFTFKNGTGDKKQDSEGNATTEAFEHNEVKGSTIKQTISGMQCNYSIAAKKNSTINVTSCENFDPSSNGEKIWSSLKENGFLNEKSSDKNMKSE